jgi:hypothetical protein
MVSYFGVASISPQARATAESGVGLPGNVAQPPFSTKDPCCHELIFFNSTRVPGESVACWNLSTQMGARAATTALLALFCAISLAVPPSVHPPQLKPMTMVVTAPTAAPCSKRLSDWPCRIEGTCIGCFLWREERAPQQRVDMGQRRLVAPAPNAARFWNVIVACRWHQRCRFGKAATSVCHRFVGRTQRSWSVYDIWADSA